MAQQTFQRARSACPTCFDPVNALTMNYIAAGHHRSAYRTLQRYLADGQIPNDNKKKAQKLMTMLRKIAKARKQKISKRDSAIKTN